MFTALSLELFPLLLLFSTLPHNLFRWKLLIPHSQASFRSQSLVQHFSLFSLTCLLPGIVRAQQVLAYLPAFFLWCPRCLNEFSLPPWTPGVTVGFSNGSTDASHISSWLPVMWPSFFLCSSNLFIWSQWWILSPCGTVPHLLFPFPDRLSMLALLVHFPFFLDFQPLVPCPFPPNKHSYIHLAPPAIG